MYKNLTLFHIAAVDDRWGIAKEGKIPWFIREDLKFFRDNTMGSTVVMGRKTWETLPALCLPGRPLVVVSRQDPDSVMEKKFGAAKPPSVIFAKNLIPALNLCGRMAEDGTWTSRVAIAGGVKLYQMTRCIVDRLILTMVDGDFGCDQFYPEPDHNWYMEEEGMSVLTPNQKWLWTAWSRRKNHEDPKAKTGEPGDPTGR